MGFLVRIRLHRFLIRISDSIGEMKIYSRDLYREIAFRGSVKMVAYMVQ